MHRTMKTRRHQDENKTGTKQPQRTQYTWSQNQVCTETKVNQQTPWWRVWTFTWRPPTDHLEGPTDMHARYYHMLISFQKNHKHAKHFLEIQWMCTLPLYLTWNEKGVRHIRLEERSPCAWHCNKGYLLNSIHCTVELLPDLRINLHFQVLCSLIF